MMSHSDENEEAIVRIEKEIQNQNQKFIDMEQMHDEKAGAVRTLVAGLLENIDSMQRSLMKVLNMMKELMGEGDKMHEECHKELQQLKVMNSNISHDMDSIKKEHEHMSKELKKKEALYDPQQKNTIGEIQKDVMRLNSLTNELKEQNEQLNAKIIQLEPENKRKRKVGSDNELLQYTHLLEVKVEEEDEEDPEEEEEEE